MGSSGTECTGDVVRKRQRRMVADDAGVVMIRHGKVEGCVRGLLGGQRPPSAALGKGYWRCDVVSQSASGWTGYALYLGKFALPVPDRIQASLTKACL